MNCVLLVFVHVSPLSVQGGGEEELECLCQNSHEDDERDFPPSDIAAPSRVQLLYEEYIDCNTHLYNSPGRLEVNVGLMRAGIESTDFGREKVHDVLTVDG